MTTIYYRQLVYDFQPGVSFYGDISRKFYRFINTKICCCVSKMIQLFGTVVIKGSRPSDSSVERRNQCRSCGLRLVSDFEFFRDVGESSVQKGRRYKCQKKFLLEKVFFLSLTFFSASN